MKKFWPLLILLISSLFIISCDNSDDNDSNNNNVNVEYPAVFDLTFNFTKVNDFTYYYPHDFSGMLSQDIILVYRRDYDNNNAPYWQSLPKTYYVDNGSLEYNYNFVTNNVQINLDSSFNLSAATSDIKSRYMNNQTFRVVLVPTIYGNKNANVADLHKMSYEDVIKKYNINDSNVTTLK